MTERTLGRSTSENAGMSSENYVRIIMVESLRFLEEGSSAQGKPGAKARPRGVVDAQTVEIPSPPKSSVYGDAGGGPKRGVGRPRSCSGNAVRGAKFK